MLDDLYTIVMSPLLRAFFRMLGTVTGVWIRFEKVSGNFFSYRACLEGVELEISKHIRCAVKSCAIEFSMLDFSLDTLIVSKVTLEGARFEYQHMANQDLIPRTLPPFLIRELVIKDGVVVFTDPGQGAPASLTLQLDDYRCEALHSKGLLFNAIFTSHIQGRIEDAPFSILYQEAGQKCVSQWNIRDLPTQVVSPFVNGKLDLIRQSAMNVVVSNEWQLEADEMTMTVQVLILDLVNFELPAILPVPTRMLADALGILINQQVKEIPIAFQFKLRKDDFMNLKDIDTAAILTAFAEALTKAILDKNLQSYDQIWDLGFRGLDTLIDITNLFKRF